MAFAFGEEKGCRGDVDGMGLKTGCREEDPRTLMGERYKSS